MIRLATVFSGIGAIEHALDRMGVENEIVFACDNGDVDVLSKKIDLNLLTMENEFISLKSIISNIEAKKETSISKEELKKELEKNYGVFVNELDKLYGLDDEYTAILSKMLIKIESMPNVKKARVKEYGIFLKNIKSSKNDKNTMFLSFLYSVEILNDFRKDNSWASLDESNVVYKSSDNINWNSIISELSYINEKLELYAGKKAIKRMRDICERLGMLHEKINVFNVNQELLKLETFEERKQYVDSLYKKKDSQNNVKKSYLANYNLDEKNFHWNVSFLEGSHYKGKVDLFVGGSPCQSFSLVGKQRGLEDTRGTLFYEYARLIDEIKPKVFIYENVKAVLSNDEGRTWKVMQKVFTDLKYTWKQIVLNAKDYGIPQNRERIFVIGIRNDLVLKREFSYPKTLQLDKKMQDFLLDNVSGKYYLQRKGVEFVTDEKNLTKRYTQIDGEVQLCQKKCQQYNWHGDFVFVEENKDMEKTMKDLEKYFLSEKVRKYVMSTGTKSFVSKPKVDLEIARPLLTTMHKMHRAGVDNYVTTEGRLRKLTPRECLRLMGFCDSFKIIVSDTSMYQQAGNSIVVDVLMAIMSEILECYDFQ